MITVQSAIAQIVEDFEIVALGVRKDRIDTYKNVTRTFATMASLHQMLRDPELPRIIVNDVSLETVSAISALADSLQHLFFEESQRVVLTIDKQSSPLRPLAEFVRDDMLNELTKYVKGCLDELGRFGREPHSPIRKGWESELANFMIRWLEGVSARTAFRNPESLDDVMPRAEATKLSTSMLTAIDYWISEIEDRRATFRNDLAVASTEEAAEKAKSQIEESTQMVRLATGNAGALVLGSHYQQLSVDERRRAQLWSAATALSIAAAVVLAITTLGNWVSGTGWSTQLVHLSITLPIIAGGVYASRVSSRHRAQAWKAADLAAQLQTLGAFTDALGNDAQSRLREHLGMQVFVGVGDERTDNHEADSTAIAEQILGGLSRVLPNKG